MSPSVRATAIPFFIFFEIHPLCLNRRWHISCDDIIIFQPTRCNWCHQRQKINRFSNAAYLCRMPLSLSSSTWFGSALNKRENERPKQQHTKKAETIHIKIINYTRHGYLLLAANVSVCKCDSRPKTAVVLVCLMPMRFAKDKNQRNRGERRVREGRRETMKNYIAAKIQ